MLAASHPVALVTLVQCVLATGLPFSRFKSAEIHHCPAEFRLIRVYVAGLFVRWCNLCTKLGFALCRRQIRETLGHQSFRYSLLVHCDESAPPLDFTPASATLQVLPLNSLHC